MKYEVILRGVRERVVSRVPIEMEQASNACLPIVLEINPEVCSFSISVMFNSSGNRHIYTNALDPFEIDHTQLSGTPGPAKHFVLFFNCRGARDPAVRRAVNDLVQNYGFSVVVLTETRARGVEAEEVIGELGFSWSFIIDPVGNHGGVWLLWDESRINVDVIDHDQYSFCALAQAPILAANVEEGWQYVFGAGE